MAENFVSSGNDDGKRQGQTEIFEKLINRIESLKTFIAKTANCVGFVADGLESESSCVEGASVILHTIEIDVRNELDDIDEVLSALATVGCCITGADE